MGKIPVEILLLIAIVIAVKLSSMVRASLPYEPGNSWTPEDTDHVQ